MKKYALTLSVLPLFLLAACNGTTTTTSNTGSQDSSVNEGNEQYSETGVSEGTSEDTTKDQKMMKGNASTQENAGTQAMMTGEYKDFSQTSLPAKVLTDGKTKVLYFFAAWCPICHQTNITLSSWYGQNNALLTTYKINYDTEKTLEQKYGVTHQHTFVKVDGQGNVIKMLEGPSDQDLQDFLKA